MTTTHTPETMPDTSERPLVTFAVFAYNQEKYIREAVEGAFSQTYEPLEIILSDDCSSDRTFEIMKDMAANYEGPHRVTSRRNEKNQGLVNHLNSISNAFTGRFLVLAAGDDVSCPHRVDYCVDALQSNAVDLVHSDVTPMNTDGDEIMSTRAQPPLFWDPSEIENAAISDSLYIGATGAIDRRLYNEYGKISYPSAYEDLVLGFRAVMSRGQVYIPEKLVRYRVGGISQISFDRESDTDLTKTRFNTLIAHADVYRQRRKDIDQKLRSLRIIRRSVAMKLHQTKLKVARHKNVLLLSATVLSRPIYSIILVLQRHMTRRSGPN